MENKQYLLMTFQLYLPYLDQVFKRSIAWSVFLELCQIPLQEFEGDVGLVYLKIMEFVNYEYGECGKPEWFKSDWLSKEF